MRYSFFILFLLMLYSCDSNKPKKIEEPKALTNECETGRDTVDIEILFSKDTTVFPSKRLYSVIDYIKGKGLFKPYADKTFKLKIEKGHTKLYPVAYDTCNHKKWIEKSFILKNINVASLDFKASRPDKYTGLIPLLHLEEWKFANNLDRDSAMKIVITAYQSPITGLMYEKRYSQFILDNQRMFLLEARAKFAEQYAIDYKKFIENFLSTLSHNNH